VPVGLQNGLLAAGPEQTPGDKELLATV